MLNKKDYNESSNQAWPSFVDILSSTIVVLCFALLIVVIVLSVSTVSSSVGTQSDESSPSEIYAQTDILGEYRAEFQKVLIVASPSLRRKMEIETKEPAYEEPDALIFSPDPLDVDSSKPVQESGDDVKQILGDIPKNIDSKSSVVLKELLIVQRDVIEQQRKVIEQKNEEVEETAREYQSLLSLITKENEIEDIKQQINPKEDSARFIDTEDEGQILSGPNLDPSGSSRYALNKSDQYSKPVEIDDTSGDLVVDFNDNSAFLLDISFNQLKEKLIQKLPSLTVANEVILEARMSDFAISQAEAQRVAVDRLLVIRSLLEELGVPSSIIKLRTLDKKQNNMQEDNYGSVTIK